MVSLSRKYLALIFIFLIAVIAAGGVFAWSRYGGSEPVEVLPPSEPQTAGMVYVGGAVVSPGFYPLKAGDTLDALVRGAGGATSDADTVGNIRVELCRAGAAVTPQKVDLNRAGKWLLEALPGIGGTRAQAIIDYRDQNGGFSNVNELPRVKGISSAIYEDIKDLVTVAE